MLLMITILVKVDFGYLRLERMLAGNKSLRNVLVAKTCFSAMLAD